MFLEGELRDIKMINNTLHVFTGDYWIVSFDSGGNRKTSWTFNDPDIEQCIADGGEGRVVVGKGSSKYAGGLYWYDSVGTLISKSTVSGSPAAIAVDTVNEYIYGVYDVSKGIRELRVYDENFRIIARHRGLDGSDQFYGLFGAGHPLIRYGNKLVKLSVLNTR